MRRLGIGIDPDTTSTGLAVVHQLEETSYRTLYVALVKARGKKAADRRAPMARALLETMRYLQSTFGINGDDVTVAVEWMKLRPTGERRPNDIVNLNGIAGAALAAAAQLKHAELLTPEPVAWKGSIPKDVKQRRVLRHLGLTEDLKHSDVTLGKIAGADQIPASKKTHVLDALGLAEWALTERR